MLPEGDPRVEDDVFKNLEVWRFPKQHFETGAVRSEATEVFDSAWIPNEYYTNAGAFASTPSAYRLHSFEIFEGKMYFMGSYKNAHNFAQDVSNDLGFVTNSFYLYQLPINEEYTIDSVHENRMEIPVTVHGDNSLVMDEYHVAILDDENRYLRLLDGSSGYVQADIDAWPSIGNSIVSSSYNGLTGVSITDTVRS